MTRRRALASACALYGRATVASALAHLSGLPPGARVSIRGAGHRAVVTRADGTRDASANVGAWVPLIPRHVEDCPACSRLACESIARRNVWADAERDEHEALSAFLEPATALD